MLSNVSEAEQPYFEISQRTFLRLKSCYDTYSNNEAAFETHCKKIVDQKNLINKFLSAQKTKGYYAFVFQIAQNAGPVVCLVDERDARTVKQVSSFKKGDTVVLNGQFHSFKRHTNSFSGKMFVNQPLHLKNCKFSVKNSL